MSFKPLLNQLLQADGIHLTDAEPLLNQLLQADGIHLTDAEIEQLHKKAEPIVNRLFRELGIPDDADIHTVNLEMEQAGYLKLEPVALVGENGVAYTTEPTEKLFNLLNSKD